MKKQQKQQKQQKQYSYNNIKTFENHIDSITFDETIENGTPYVFHKNYETVIFDDDTKGFYISVIKNEMDGTDEWAEIVDEEVTEQHFFTDVNEADAFFNDEPYIQDEHDFHLEELLKLESGHSIDFHYTVDEEETGYNDFRGQYIPTHRYTFTKEAEHVLVYVNDSDALGHLKQSAFGLKFYEYESLRGSKWLDAVKVSKLSELDAYVYNYTN